jgi:colanic acid/amylovoran biosynthesis protein
VIRAERLYRRFARDGRPVVLLPQALGPFTAPAIEAAFAALASRARLIFARDRDSLAHARRLAPTADLRLAPDFTAGVGAGMEHPDGARYAGRAVVIPNLRMLDRTAAADQAWYLDAVARAVAWLEDQGTAPYVLLVEAGDRAVMERLPAPARTADVVWEPDPLRIKALLASARLVVGARYHGLASALAQGVPAIGLGWSHKYAALFEDYGCPELLLQTGADAPALERQLARLLDPTERAAITAMLAERATAIRRATDEMWAAVRQVAGVHA